ncbi:NAD(P)-binding protein [Micromonospora sp. DR5-3]|uniref:NAD(P)-binding protein n=2 Tax=unclassified Micromonospora TaxID=2617518 RepID=UPI0011D61BEF|nr:MULTISPECIES: NAD(P)-binding protein [unclassified Micromonospora]MCW3819720.1 NAD(P)-binding protein [Micromonospora sp. DR5-3]TYC14928.1 NAD(P)-binding protein [Micromonospora sp. MP36]
MAKLSDEELGMSTAIRRRDLLNGALIAAGAAALTAIPGTAHASSRGSATPLPRSTPPAQTGLVGQTDAARAAGHGATFGGANFGRPRRLREVYDLVVVGGGVSGLAAAHFYRKAHGPNSRILVLEALGDFGGHQHRNEFTVDGRMLLSNGGMVNLDSPDTWNPASRGLMDDLGIDFAELAEGVDTGFYERTGLTQGYFFPEEHFGTDTFLRRAPGEPVASLVSHLPLSEQARADILKVEKADVDYLAGMTDAEKKQHLARMTYKEYLQQYIGVGDEALVYYQKRPHGLWGAGIEAVPAGDCWGVGYPGFGGLGLTPEPYPGIGRTPAMSLTTTDEELYYFPDGGATVSRLLVSRLVPRVFAPGQTMSSIITAHANYAQLDQPGNAVRIRLGSMATRVRHRNGTSGDVDVTYVNGKQAYEVSARHVVMACWNSVSSYIIEGLPADQVAAMRYGTKVPLVYARVAIGNWKAWAHAGVSRITPYGHFWDSCGLVTPTHQGGYQSARNPQQPIVVNFSKTPNQPGLRITREQHKAGRRQLLQVSFADFERDIRDLLQRALGESGFVAKRDIRAITVNRWSHGYAYEYNSIADPAIFEPLQNQPFARARVPLGNITIANSDAQAFGYTHAAIDEAARAVSELG